MHWSTWRRGCPKSDYIPKGTSCTAAEWPVASVDRTYGDAPAHCARRVQRTTRCGGEGRPGHTAGHHSPRLCP
eukprot:14362883-Alexandrium_andersonii.AAC.1